MSLHRDPAPAQVWPSDIRHGWLGADISREQVTHRLTLSERRALRDLVTLARATGRAMEATTAANLPFPDFDETLFGLAHHLRWGPGLVVIAGIPLADYDAEALRWLYWLIGARFGKAVSQNIHGSRMGEVRIRDDAVTGRAYNVGGSLPFHSDRIDVLSLFGIRRAQSGGANLFASSLAIHDAILAERPDLMPLFERGFYQHLGNEHAPDGDPVTPHRLPVFGVKDGLRSCLFSGNASLTMQRAKLADRLTPEEDAALVYLRSVVDRPEFAVRMMLEEGEMVFVNNYEVLHAREDFTDTPDDRRCLLRLWLQGEPWRPKPDAMLSHRNASGEQGIDARPEAVLAAAA